MSMSRSRSGARVIRLASIVAALSLLLAANTTAPASENTAAGSPDNGSDQRKLENWEFIFTPYAWVPVVQGSIGVGSIDIPINLDVTDLLNNSDRVGLFMGAFEIAYKCWFVYADATWSKFGFDSNVGTLVPITAKTDLSFTFADFALGRRLLEGKPRTIQPWTVDVLAGARYTRQKYSIDIAGAPLARIKKEWTDPIIGSRVKLDMSDRWRFVAYGDVGGFGLASDISAQGRATVGYRFKLGPLRSEVAAGYRAIYQKFTDGGVNSALRYDATIHGPIIRFELAY